MAELKTKEGELTAADLATFGILPKQSEKPRRKEKMMKPSTKDKVEGKLHEVKGEIKKEVGKATNNPDLEVSGKGGRERLARFKIGSAALKKSSGNEKRINASTQTQRRYHVTNRIGKNG